MPAQDMDTARRMEPLLGTTDSRPVFFFDIDNCVCENWKNDAESSFLSFWLLLLTMAFSSFTLEVCMACW